MNAQAEEVVLDTSVPSNTNNFNLPIPKIQTEIRLFNTNNNAASQPDQASQANITFSTMNIDDSSDDNNNTNQLLDPILEEKEPEKKEKPKKKPLATANNNEKIEEMVIETAVTTEKPQEQTNDVIMDNNINVTTPPKIKLTIQVETPNTNAAPNTNKTPKQKKRKIVEEDDNDEDFTPGSKKKSAKKKRGTYDSDDDDDYAPNKKEAKKKDASKKRGRKDENEDEGDSWTPNKKMKLNDGSSKKNKSPRFFFASSGNTNVTTARENGNLIANDIKSWVTALEALKEKDMTPAVIAEEKTEPKVESTPATATPITPEGKSPKLRKSPSQTKIDKPSHKVDVEKFYECLRPIDWTHQAPEKVRSVVNLIHFLTRLCSLMVCSLVCQLINAELQRG